MLLVLLFTACFAQQCQIFGCGNINNGNNSNAQVICGNNTNTNYNLAPCPQNYTCSLNGIGDPLAVNNIAKCVPNAQNPQIEPQSRNTGDICFSNTNCASNNCANGVCQAVSNLSCANSFGTAGCPVGTFCNLNNQCQQTLPSGATCNPLLQGQCGIAGVCLLNDNIVATCVPYFSVPSGQRMRSIPDPYICQSVQVQYISGSFFCMPGS